MALTSLYTGISGLSASSLALSVIGDNIANMNTTAYKSSTIQFGDILSSSLSTGGGSSQVGRGVLTESVTPDFSQGSFSTTSNALDLAIDGDGFFMVKDNTGSFYTRAGSMSTDKDGNIVDPNHCVLQGYMYDDLGNISGVLGNINISSVGSSTQATANMTLSDNLDSRASINDTNALTLAGTLNSGDPLSGTDTNKLAVGGNLDTAESVPVTSPFDASDPTSYNPDATQTVQVTDSTGATQNLNIYYVNNGAGWDWHAQDAAAPGVDLGTGSMTFDAGTGALTSPSTANISYGTPAQTINLDFSALTNVAAGGTSATTLTASNQAFDPTNSATFDYQGPDIQVHDSTGHAETVSMYYTKNDANTWTYHAVVPAASSPTGLPQEQATGTLTFDPVTQALTSNPTASATFTFANGTASQPISLDLSGLTQTAAADTTTATTNANGFNVADPTGTSQFSTAITVYDSLGNARVVTTYFTKSLETQTGNQWTWNAVVGANDSASGLAEVQASGVMTFDNTGGLTSVTGNTGQTFNFGGGAAANQPMALKFSNFTQFASGSATVSQTQDGFPAGSLNSFSISQDGIISGIFSNGQIKDVAKIALAKFTSPTALTKDGRNLYSESFDSGQPIIGTPQNAGLGRVMSNSLELSNVDLATQFVDMISAQRAFQANSRVITTTDSLLQEILQLVR